MNLKFYLKAPNLRFGLRLLRTYVSYKIGNPTPVIVTLRITFRCNLKCRFCSLWKLPKTKEINLSQIRMLIDDMERLGVPYLNITGGEPLLREDIEKIGEYAHSKGIFTLLNTNAMFITKKRAKMLANSFDIIKVSIDGLEGTHDKIRGKKGAFKLAEAGLRKIFVLKGRGAKVMVHFVANQFNIKEIPKFIERYQNCTDAITIMPEFSTRKGKVFNSPEFLEGWKLVNKRYNLQESKYILKSPSLSLGKEYCEAGRLYYSILPDGRIVCCSNYFYQLGNLNNERFYDVWKRGITESNKEIISKCNGCFCRSTTEVSMLMRKSPLELLFTAPSLIRRYKL